LLIRKIFITKTGKIMTSKSKKILPLVFMSTVLVAPSHAITITTSSDTSFLLDTLFTDSSGISIQGGSLSFGDIDEFTGSINSIGAYTNSSGTYGLPFTGIVLSTGNVLDYIDGPNTETEKTTSFSDNSATPEQNELLNPITGTGTSHFDVTQLNIQFSVAPNVDTISFNAVFGSEEYPEFVGSSFNDGFGIYVNGQNVAGAIPTGGEAALPININHPDFIPHDDPVLGSLTTELDGVLAPNGNPVLRFDIPVESGSIDNTMTIIIGDRSDSTLDTTVYIATLGEPGSNPAIPVLPSNGLPDENGTFNFEIFINGDGLGTDFTQPIWIDPVVAIGYTYAIAEGSNFSGVVMPDLAIIDDPNGYELWLWNGTDFVFHSNILSGDSFDFTTLDPNGVDRFQIRGVDAALELDPLNPKAFPTGIVFNNFGLVKLSMTPIIEDDTDDVEISILDQIVALKTASWNQVSDRPVRITANARLAQAIHYYNIAAANFRQNKHSIGNKYLILVKNSINKFISTLERGVTKNKFPKTEILPLLEAAESLIVDINFIMESSQ
jgi:hypothetical protein